MLISILERQTFINFMNRFQNRVMKNYMHKLNNINEYKIKIKNY